MAFDTTEQYQARRRLEVLDKASMRIGTTLDLARTAEELAEVAVGCFADFVAVDLLDAILSGDDSEPAAPVSLVFRRVAQQSVLEGCPESVISLDERHTYHEQSPPGQALATGRAMRHPVVEETRMSWAIGVPERAHSMRTYEVHSTMVVPLQARGTTLGVALFARHRTPEPFDDGDQSLAEQLAARAAVCVDNARRYTRERNTSLALQRSLLPREAPRQTAVEIASRYLPAEPRAGVGGDWFDVIPLSGTRVALVVGDVVGHGIQASATMGWLRMAVRTLADVDVAPDELLTQLDDLVLRLDRDEEGAGYFRSGSGEMGASCLYVVYDPTSGHCSMARAGHPAPALVTPDGNAYIPDLPAGPPLGLGRLPFESAEFDLSQGSVLALYTNGLIQSVGHDVDAGLALLRDVLSRSELSLEERCDAALRVLLPDQPTDDVALLLARTRLLDAEHHVSWDLPVDPAVVSGARRSVCDRLVSWELEDLSFTTELVVSEMVTNAIRYGGSPIRLRLIRDDDCLICEVSDGSSAAPHLRRARVFDEGGRGLLLVAQLTDRWGTRHVPEGKIIWAEQALTSPKAAGLDAPGLPFMFEEELL
ncbi:SpoIIE family protein phosphatase [Streptomyces sp. NPDC004629]|uniref:ATP-binding SpoIIE family protein phosphatase n=1 Tax=Streptomyces sp. NPDC004629 TaxID=3364705 RepID=UPI0036739073